MIIHDQLTPIESCDPLPSRYKMSMTYLYGITGAYVYTGDFTNSMQVVQRICYITGAKANIYISQLCYLIDASPHIAVSLNQLTGKLYGAGQTLLDFDPAVNTVTVSVRGSKTAFTAPASNEYFDTPITPNLSKVVGSSTSFDYKLYTSINPLEGATPYSYAFGYFLLPILVTIFDRVL